MAHQRIGELAPQPEPATPQVTEAPLRLPADHLPEDSAGQVNPRYRLVPRSAGRLATSMLAIEPVLGPVRVSTVLPPRGDRPDRTGLVRIAWTDDDGPCRVTAHYPADRILPVRAPAHEDELAIHQGIDQAAWRRQVISGAIARLIAAHLHTGTRSALYGFAVNGAVPDRLYDELNRIDSARPTLRPWVHALARHCVSRDDLRPIPGWGRQAPHPRTKQLDEQLPTKAALYPLVGNDPPYAATVAVANPATTEAPARLVLASTAKARRSRNHN